MKYGDIYSHFLKTWNTSNTSRQLDVGNVLQNNCWHGVSNLIWWNLYVATLPIWDVNGRSLRVFLPNHNSIWTSNRSTALVPILYYKGIAKNICQLQCKDFRPRTFVFWRHYPQILNTPFRISNWTGSWNRHWLAENWHLYSRNTSKDKKSLMSVTQNIRRNFPSLTNFLGQDLAFGRNVVAVHHLVGAFAVFTLPSNFTWEANLAQGEVSLVTDTLRGTHILFF